MHTRIHRKHIATETVAMVGRTDGRTMFRPFGPRRKSSLFGNNDNDDDDDAGRSIYLEETKAPPMAIISRVYMHRSVHCSIH